MVFEIDFRLQKKLAMKTSHVTFLPLVLTDVRGGHASNMILDLSNFLNEK